MPGQLSEGATVPVCSSLRTNWRATGRKLYHQLHPVKLATDIAATFPFLYILWHHHIVWA
jgi:hypothetical protein